MLGVAQPGDRTRPILILFLIVGERLPVAGDEAGFGLLGGPGRREATRSAEHLLTPRRFYA
jgi:hypothetical protein